MYGALGMTGTLGGLAARAGRVSTEATGRFGCTNTQTPKPRRHQHCNMMPYHFRLMINTLLTGGLGRFFLLVVDLEPEKRLFRAASAALALATFLLGPVPRKTCLSTSTCYNTQRWVCLRIRFTTNVPLMFVTRLILLESKLKLTICWFYFIRLGFGLFDRLNNQLSRYHLAH